MLFNTADFAFFFAAVFILTLLLPHRLQNRMLLAGSYLFYAAWDWRFLSLLAISTLVDYFVGRALGSESNPRRRRLLVTTSIVVNLGILGCFKYAGFFAESLRGLFAGFGVELPDFVIRVVLPVGISFYTFQTLSYTIDLYRGKLEPTRNLLDFALYVAFFPQLVAGPIERATRLLPQVLAPRRITWAAIRSGAWLVLWGYFKKVVIADNLATLVDAVYAPSAQPTGGELMLATYAFTIQIYCDFSGYTDIARGVARILGFDLMVNFRLPYWATSPADHWRRWHISLSSWLRDYLYISLGGNRRGGLRTYVNLMITMVLGGLWHGAAWPFVLWGAFHGAALCIHRALQPLLARVAPRGFAAHWLWWGLRVLFTFHLIVFGFILFRAGSLEHIGRLLAVLADGLAPGMALAWILPFGALVAPLVIMEFGQWRSGELEPVIRLPLALRSTVYALVFLAIALIGEDGGEAFIYFQF
jgi:D-alanyl-lipoteichoic acid acyltransferase DltB (MBOAT superfamily)